MRKDKIPGTQELPQLCIRFPQHRDRGDQFLHNPLPN